MIPGVSLQLHGRVCEMIPVSLFVRILTSKCNLNLVRRKTGITHTDKEIVLDSHYGIDIAFIGESARINQCFHCEMLHILHLCKVVPYRPCTIFIHIRSHIDQSSLHYHKINSLYT